MLYVYFFAPINLLNFYIENADFSRLHTLFNGQYIVSGFSSIFSVLANKIFHTDFSIPLAQMNAVTSNFVYISPTIHMNNNCTTVYAALRDFGKLGLVIYPFVISTAMHYSAKLYAKSPSLLSLSLYSYSLVILVFLLFEWMPARINVMMGWVLILFFYKASHIKLTRGNKNGKQYD
ncbi:hypothetical protein RyT2_09730 [Pseudolactococcus yaeyamensis]